MKTSHPGGDHANHLADQLNLLTTIDEFPRSPTICEQLAVFLTARSETGPTGNSMFAACTLIDLFSFNVAALHRHPDQH
jgi:hypothetical protein